MCVGFFVCFLFVFWGVFLNGGCSVLSVSFWMWNDVCVFSRLVLR